MAKDEADELFKDFGPDEEKPEKKKPKRVELVESRVVDRGNQKREQIKEFVIRYKPVLVERLIFLAIIAGLITYMTYSEFGACPFSSLFEKEKVIVVAENTTKENKTVPLFGIKQEPKEEPKEEPQEEPKPEIKPPEPGGPVTIAIDKVDFTRDNSSYPLKMKSVAYTIDNKKGDIIPTIKVYWYDADSEVIIKNKVRTSFTFGIALKAGQKVSGTLKTFDSYFFDKIKADEETVKVELIDSETGEILQTQTTKIK